MNSYTTIEKDIDALKQFNKEQLLRNLDIVKQQTQFAKDLQNIIEGCMKLLDTLVAHGDRMDEMSARIDIANKRLRKLEKVTVESFTSNGFKNEVH